MTAGICSLRIYSVGCDLSRSKPNAQVLGVGGNEHSSCAVLCASVRARPPHGPAASLPLLQPQVLGPRAVILMGAAITEDGDRPGSVPAFSPPTPNTLGDRTTVVTVPL